MERFNLCSIIIAFWLCNTEQASLDQWSQLGLKESNLHFSQCLSLVEPTTGLTDEADQVL